MMNLSKKTTKTLWCILFFLVVSNGLSGVVPQAVAVEYGKISDPLHERDKLANDIEINRKRKEEHLQKMESLKAFINDVKRLTEKHRFTTRKLNRYVETHFKTISYCKDIKEKHMDKLIKCNIDVSSDHLWRMLIDDCESQLVLMKSRFKSVKRVFDSVLWKLQELKEKNELAMPKYDEGLQKLREIEDLLNYLESIH